MRKDEIYHSSMQILKEGRKPSVSQLSEETGFPVQDVHRCLNVLEKEGRIKTYSREVLGRKLRMVSV